MSKIAKAQQEPELKRMNLNIPLSLHNAFKSLTAAQGASMTDVLLKYIQECVEQQSTHPKGRRK